jgi:hypothetical protein
MSQHKINECQFRSATDGLADFEVASAITGYFTPEECTTPPVEDGELYYWRAESDDLSQHELFEGAYIAATDTVERTTILQSSNGGAKVNFATEPRVRQVGLAQDFGAPQGGVVTYDASDNNQTAPTELKLTSPSMQGLDELGPELITNGSFTGSAATWITTTTGSKDTSETPYPGLAGGWSYTGNKVSWVYMGNDGANIVCARSDTPGTGYTVSDILTLDSEGDGNATVEVLTIDGTGGVLTVDVVSPGTGYSLSGNSTCTGGTGTGAEFRYSNKGYLVQDVAGPYTGPVSISATLAAGGEFDINSVVFTASGIQDGEADFPTSYLSIEPQVDGDILDVSVKSRTVLSAARILYGDAEVALQIEAAATGPGTDTPFTLFITDDGQIGFDLPTAFSFVFRSDGTPVMFTTPGADTFVFESPIGTGGHINGINFAFQSGAGVSGGAGGSFELQAGAGDGVGGNIALLAGAGNTDDGGNISITAGDSTDAAGGNITLQAGESDTSNGNIILSNLPSADPGIPGALYQVAGAVMISL